MDRLTHILPTVPRVELSSGPSSSAPINKTQQVISVGLKGAEVVSPGTPRAKSSTIWDRIGTFFKDDIPDFFISTFHACVNQTIYSLLPPKSTEEKLAGCMDSLLDELLQEKNDGNWDKVSKKIVDIEMRTCGLAREENFKRQVYSRLMRMSNAKASDLYNKLSRCRNCIGGGSLLSLIDECFQNASRNNAVVLANFQQYFEIKLELGWNQRANLIVSLPARYPTFPNRYLAVEEMARFLVKYLTEDEQHYLSQINVEAFPEDQKYWAFLCRKESADEIASKAAAREIKRREFDANVGALFEKIQGGVEAIAKKIGCLVVHAPDGTSITDKRLVGQLASLVMELCRRINCTDQTDRAVVEVTVAAVVQKDFNIYEGVKERVGEVIGDGSSWKVKIKEEIADMNARQVAQGKPVFNFNPKSIPNPVEPNVLVDIIFEAGNKG